MAPLRLLALAVSCIVGAQGGAPKFLMEPFDALKVCCEYPAVLNHTLPNDHCVHGSLLL